MALSSNELDRLKAAFLAIISHELRTPLTEIMAAASLLGDGYLGSMTEDQRHYLALIENSAGHLEAIIQDLLSFAQLQSQVTELLLEYTYLSEIAQEASERYQAQIEKKHLHLITRWADNLGPLLLDRVKMTHVISNLLSNAVNFTPEGERILLRTQAVEGGQVLDVADTGVGISKEKLGRIFESFYQAEDPLTRTRGGLGIGLAYARQIVEAHHGRMTVESVPGKGSLFSVWLPDPGKLGSEHGHD